MNLEDMIEYAEEYDHKIVDKLENNVGDEIKGKIVFSSNEILYNRNYEDEYVDTFCHELYHHYFVKELNYDMPESLVEDLGLKMSYYNRKYIQDYLNEKLYEEKDEKKDFRDL